VRLAENRSPFVGRERELRQLQAAFGAAAAGDGALVMLVGEPGIGKTTVCDQLCRFVFDSGGLPLVGCCYEEGSFRRPYQPFVEAFSTYLRECDFERLTAELGSSGAELARMVPMLRERLDVTPRASGDPEEDRWRLLDAAMDLLRAVASKQPLLVVLEDLHDADRGTLDLLLHVVRNIRGTRLLLVGTYRDVEVDRAHPLAAALTGLHRLSNVARIQLRGLSTNEVHELLAETSQQAIPPPFAELVHRQTEGNPLFVSETLRYVIDAGLVERRNGTLWRVGERSLAGRIPEGLRDAVGKRLSRLSEGTNRALSVASVVGREFELDVLRQVLVRPEEELEAGLEEASAAGIIEERSFVGTTITYQFNHAFFRQTLYDEIVAPRRIRLHQQIARALEEVHGRRLEEHAAELAEHYAFSSDPSDLSKAVEYATLAAERAMDVFAYGEAARQLERALAVQDLVDPDDGVKRLELLLTLGAALVPSGETERVLTQVAPDTFALAEELNDRSLAFRACRLALDCLFAQGAGAGLGGGSSTGQPTYLIWAERASRYADPDSIERAYTNLAFAHALYVGGQFAEARALRLQALALARQHADAEAMFSCAIYLLAQGAPKRWDERVRLAEECAGWPRQGVSGRTLGLALWYAGLVQLAEGQRTQAEELFGLVAELAARTRVATVGLFAAGSDASLAVVDGHLDHALGLIKRYIERADESGAPNRGRGFALPLLIAPALYLGRADLWLSTFDEAAPSLARPGLVAGSFIRAASRAICLAQVGRVEAAWTLVGPVLDEIAEGGDDEFPIAHLTFLLQAAVALEHKAAAQALVARLACVAHLTGDILTRTCVARHLGDAAVLLGDRVSARAYYIQALTVAGKVRFRPELALTHLRLAELLCEDEVERSVAREHLNLALPELRDMQMQPALARALALSHELDSAPGYAPPRASASIGLTSREREIASLIADGRSNHEIAERLVITEGTVEVHVKHILSKLGFRSRTQVASWFADKVVEEGA
jgi:DNA-binding CsgD family transcriptional regulator